MIGVTAISSASRLNIKAHNARALVVDRVFFIAVASEHME